MSEENTPTEAELIEAAKDAAANGTRADVRIGAAVVDQSGEVHTGTIVETRDRHQSIHAERLAIQKAISEGAEYVAAIAIYSNVEDVRMCGSCLQVLYEFSAGRNPPVIIATDDGTNRFEFRDLYPEPWPPEPPSSGNRGDGDVPEEESE